MRAGNLTVEIGIEDTERHMSVILDSSRKTGFRHSWPLFAADFGELNLSNDLNDLVGIDLSD